MGTQTNISWTDATYNPWHGCAKISPGCAKCYMFTAKVRYGQDPTQVIRTKPPTLSAPLKWQQKMAGHTYSGKHHGETLLVFTCSWSDFFIEDADAWREDVWQIIRQTPNLTYQILTKRPERIAAHLPPDWGIGYPNVWLGVSVENQRWLSRLAVLRQVPATIRFASFEPLLQDMGDMTPWLPGLDWAIVGGESGAGYRPMAVEWLYNVVSQCQTAGIATWVKQDSGFKDGLQGRLSDAVWGIKQFPPLWAPTPQL